MLFSIRTKGGEMELNFTYTRKDIQKASYLKGSDNRKRARKILIPLGLFLLFFALITSSSSGFKSGEFIIIGASLFSIFFADVILPILNYFLTNAVIQRNKDILFAPQKMIVSDNGICFENKYGKSLTEWSSFTKYITGKDIILLYISQNMAFNIPKESLLLKNKKKNF